ncbi:PREDICTED: uncharacterized protein LOC108747944 [Trachymyrmex septentrionalis]|uniref:uncharacterized protein LOC108747944 n=1 Tax=Trachymyrmex septentrionalis TaxID=34720 RepID=UPI00084F253C|nr:PREDICTED: uncharacterized protein LOC108747944 [Trachymyrmex septentrionalis]
MTAQTVAAAFIDGWVARFSTPTVIITDQGKQFEASLFQAFSKFLGSKKTRTSSYYPASNVLLGLHTCLKEDLKCSPAELVYGAPLRVPGEFLENRDPTEDTETFVIALRKRIRQLLPQPTQHHGKRTAFRQQQLEQATHVFVKEDGI